MANPDLITAIRDLHSAIGALIDELRRQRLQEAASLDSVVELHGQPRINPEKES